MSEQERHVGPGSIDRLSDVLERRSVRRVFLVTGRHSYTASGAESAAAAAFGGRVIARFCDFSENPKFEDVERGLEMFRTDSFDAVVAIGGGSALDIAKLVNVLAFQSALPSQVIRGEASTRPVGLPLIALPTTAGSGSEATHFAVAYIDRVKYSVASPAMLPAVAIVDSKLTYSLSPEMTAVTGLDAFAQAVESYWSIRSTDESKQLARQAIPLILEHLPVAVKAPTPVARDAMSRAAHLAGRAINISRTTGPHAVSYSLTSFYGVPHGQAVCLTLGDFLVFNEQVTPETVSDTRGASYVRETLRDLIKMLGAHTAVEAARRIREFVSDLGLLPSLTSLGVPRTDLADRILANVNTERMANNPRLVGAADLRRLVESGC